MEPGQMGCEPLINWSLHRAHSETTEKTDREPYSSFDGNHILFGNIDGTFTNCTVKQDTLGANVSLTTKRKKRTGSKEVHC